MTGSHVKKTLSRFLFPRIAMGDLKVMIAVALVGAVIGGAYGAVHDQWTFSISPEYFTKLKFQQFRFADFGQGERALVSTIGFLATFWVGLAVGWFLARRLVPGAPRGAALRKMGLGFLLVFLCVLTAEALGYAYGLWRGSSADYSAWFWAIEKYHIDEPWPFVRVAYIHNAAYLGGGMGLLLALWGIRPAKQEGT